MQLTNQDLMPGPCRLGGLVFASAVLCPSSGIQGAYGRGHLHGFAFAVPTFEHEGQWHRLAFFDLLFEVHQHDMMPAWLQFHRFASRQIEGWDMAHFHDVVLHGHFMNFDHRGQWRTC